MRAPFLVLLFTSCLTTPAPSPAESDVVRVMVWNVHAGADAAGVDNLARVAERVRAERADVVLLQEVDRGVARSGGVDQPAALARLTGMHAAFGKSLDYQGGEYGVAILSRWPVVRHAAVPLPVDPPQPRSGGATTPRTALIAHVDAPGGPLVLVDTHIDASRDDRWRRQEAARLVALVDSLVRHAPAGTTVLLGGDMNSEPASAVQATLVAAAGPMRDAWADCGLAPDDTAARSYPARAPTKRIDYLYLTGAARCRSARVVADSASDHRPVVVDVVVR
jgi:endonuclease/exonuclease/phosphatase family metal-dependent hydrolase